MIKYQKNIYPRFLLWYKSLRIFHKLFLWGAILAILLLIAPKLLSLPGSFNKKNEASFYFVEPTAILYTTNPFPLELRVDTHNNQINAVEFTLEYNSRVLEILTMTTDKSFCSFYADNSFDNIKGEAHITCGTPNPGFSGDSTIIKLSLRGKTASPTTVSLRTKESKILANDGKGTNLAKKATSINLTIKSTF